MYKVGQNEVVLLVAWRNILYNLYLAYEEHWDRNNNTYL